MSEPPRVPRRWPRLATCVALTALVACGDDLAGNPPPEVGDLTLATAEDTPLTVTVRAEDPDGEPLSYRIAAEPGHGTITGAAPTWTYTPEADFTGTDRLMMTVSDGRSPRTAAIDITVTPVADAPV